MKFSTETELAFAPGLMRCTVGQTSIILAEESKAHLQDLIGVEELRLCATMLGSPEDQQQED